MKTTNKINWTRIKEKIFDAIYFTVLGIVMLMGFWIIYYMLWDALGFPINTTAMLVLFVQALISEIRFFWQRLIYTEKQKKNIKKF